ncbi:hypothetical protein [Vibrio aestuarianus]|nr:hypothetical protein [Vibrio aestuarianus]MDE1231331.1 hypothetical protein [Vibrio aestuarianus]MDE1349416.1 hypothetical protein [Vibrio aestuarianus]
MTTYNLMFHCTFLLSCSSYVGEFLIPPSNELRTLIKSYDNQTGKTGDNVAYIPIGKPCLNVVTNGKHYEYCVINENENLSNSDKQGFYITLKSVSKSDVSFSYDTLWYSMSCRIFTEDQKIECDEPYG